MRPISPQTDSPTRGLAFRLAALALIAVTLTGASGFLMARWLRDPDGAKPAGPSSEVPMGSANLKLFRDWPTDRKPDLVLILSGQMHGYLQPCGCSKPQLGGLTRRYNFMQTLRDRGWPIAAVDLGDLIDSPQHRGPQKFIKYRTAMFALKKMNYVGVGVGLYETDMPLLTTVAEYALNEEKPPILAANLLDKKDNYNGAIKSWAFSDDKSIPKVGVTAILGPSISRQVTRQDPPAKFAPTGQVLDMALREFNTEKAEVRVLMYQGNVKEARSCANQYPQFHVILCLSDDSEPSDKPERVSDPTSKVPGALRKQPLVISVGHKGRYVGVVGMFRTGRPDQPFDMHYQLVALGEEYETPQGKINPIMTLMEDYAREVRDNKYLLQYPRSKHPVQVSYPNSMYVGSQRCIKCHKEAAKVWKDSPHSHAYQELVTATRPSLRQFDGECVKCHVVGFDHDTGFTDETQTAHLKDVGCESCHGPGSLHAAGKKDPALLQLMNPYRHKPNEKPEEAKKRKHLIDQSCQKCHDQDNDVHWDFDKKWPLIVHHEKNLR